MVYDIVLPTYIYGGFLKWRYLQIIHFNRFSIITHNFWVYPIYVMETYIYLP